MALDIERLSPTAFAVSIEGMLDREDYKQFVPPVEECIKTYGKVNPRCT